MSNGRMPLAEVEAVLVDQQRDLAAGRRGWITRDCRGEFLDMLGSSLIKVVMGVRRSGKSTLCAQAGGDEELAYCNFDDERLTGLGAADLDSVYQILLQLKPTARFLVFDEVQNVDHWELFVNRLKRKGKNILVTGSNGKLLSHELATHLTGRHLELELWPFSFGEYLRYLRVEPAVGSERVDTERRAVLQRHFQDYLERGGFPEVVAGEEPGRYLRELFDKIVSRDIVQRHEVRTPRILKELGLYLIQHSGALGSLKRLLTIFPYRSVNTLRTHIGYLHDAYLLHEVPAYSSKIRERTTSPRKSYACDPGMIAALSAKPAPDWGMRLETLVFLHLRRQRREVFYLKGQDYDVDFAVVTRREINHLVQACLDISAPETLARELGSLIRAAKHHPRARLTIVTLHDDRVIEEDGVRVEVIPGWRLCLRKEMCG